MRTRTIFLAIAGVVTLLIAVIVLRPAFTLPIGEPGVASLEQVTLGGTPQWVLIRGRDRSKPLVLFLHGGPGMPTMYLAHAFQHDLERDFVVVQWDRRGAGKSYSPDIDPAQMSMSQEIADAEQLIESLRKRLGQRKVIVVGHSYGSYLGVELAYLRPDLVRAYVGVGQIACDDVEQHAVQDAWLRTEAMAAGDSETVAAVDRGKPWDRETALFTYGGGVVGMKSFWPIVMIGLRAPEYSLRDALNVSRGVAFTHKHLAYDLDDLGESSTALMDRVPSLDVPVYFFTGRHDYITPAACTERYYARLKAPSKHLIWFEHSAHFAFLEEPQRFHEELLKVARATEASLQ